MPATAIIRLVHVYRHDGDWCYAAWTTETNTAIGFDHSDPLDIPATATSDDAERAAKTMFPDAAVRAI